jgi:hypothetical protein
MHGYEPVHARISAAIVYIDDLDVHIAERTQYGRNPTMELRQNLSLVVYGNHH